LEYTAYVDKETDGRKERKKGKEGFKKGPEKRKRQPNKIKERLEVKKNTTERIE